MALVNGRSDFDEQFFSKNTGISKGTDIFTLGGDFFSIKTNLDDRKVRDLSTYIDNFSDPITLNNIVSSDKVDIKTTSFETVQLNFDKSELSNYAYFGSLRDRMQFSILNIVNNFPSSLYVNDEYNDVLYTVLDYSYNDISNRASFKIPSVAITNNYKLKINNDNSIFTSDSDLKDVTKSYTKYSLWDFENEYPLISFTGTSINNSYIYLEVLGNPFNFMGNGLVNFHIKPNYDNYELFLKNLDDFEAYLLNRDSSPKYSAIFKVPNQDEQGNTVLIDETFVWKTTDGYNLDYNTYEFETYLKSLMALADNLDDYKSNLITRYLTTSALREFDTPDQRTDKLLKIYGKFFDDFKKYIDGLANIAKVSYDKKNNMPDILVKNFARTLGWGTFNTVTDNDLVRSFLGQDSKIILSGQTKNYTPAETDIELWRRMVINSAYLFRSKGTRECIDFLFKIVGAPKSLIEFNEYVYIAQNKIDVDKIENNSELNFPFDSDGYPKIPQNSSSYYFQMNGGWLSNREIAPTNSKNYASVIGIHTGNYDGGSAYFKEFTDFNGQKGFELNRVNDNVKSWNKDSKIHYNDQKETNYNISDSRMVLNSKEASIFMNPARAVETDVYEYNKQTGFVINSSGLTYPYPNNVLTNRDVTSMSYIEYVDFIYSNFINVKNRKVIQTEGNGYPTLKKLYEDYYNAVGSKKLDVSKVIKFINQIGDFWINLIEQFVPSTTIWQGGVVYKNTIFDRQKFDYKHGINDGSEFKTEQLVNTDVSITTAEISGTVGLPFMGNVEDLAKADVVYSSNLNFPINPDDPISDNTKNKNILRVKPFFSSEILSLVQPCITMGDVSKIITGTTEPVTHDISLGAKTINFTFDCNLDFFNTGTFAYNVYPFNKGIQEFTTGLTFTKSISGYTVSGGTIFKADSMPFIFNDGDYLVKPVFKNTIILTGDTYQGIYNYFKKINDLNLDNNTGFKLVGNSLIYDSTNLSRTNVFGIYDDDTDYWFNIISPPFKPQIKTDNYSNIITSGSTLVNTTITISTNLQKIFYLSELPSGDIFLNINGNTLLKSTQSDFSDGGEYFGEVVGNTYKITLNNGIDVQLDDVINVIYIKSNSNTVFDTLFDTISTIPSGTTASDGILYNIVTNVYEYYFPFTLGDDVNYNQLIVVLNGVKLNADIDYYMSTTSLDKIIFSGAISIGDELLFYYPNSNNNGFYLSSKTFVANWNVQNDDATGVYTVEVSELPDFSTLYMTKSTPYVPNSITTLNEYSLVVGDFTIPFKKYYYRIKSIKNHINLLGEQRTTLIYSSSAYFLTDNNVLL